MENRIMQLELKYCERCGGLWIRPKGSDVIFCAACSKAMAGLTPLGTRTAQPLTVKPDSDEKEAQEAFWGEGGNA